MKKKLISILIILAVFIGSGALLCSQGENTSLSKWALVAGGGKWSWQLKIYQDNDYIFGYYDSNGIIMGKFENRVFRGWWKNGSDECGPFDKWSGPMIFEISEDGKSLNGYWGRCSEGTYTISQIKQIPEYDWKGGIISGEININP
ncbi:MAG: hypothetical protein ACOCV8_03790 [Spirochaetota bacterium]